MQQQSLQRWDVKNERIRGMEENKTIYLTAQDVAEALNISQSMAYKLIREWNNKLKEQGKFVMAGRINERYFRQVVDVVA